MTIRRRDMLAAGAALAAGTAAGPVAAQGAYPNKIVKTVVPWPPGGNSDISLRPVTERMGQLLGQPFVVDYKPGNAGVIGTQVGARAPADGYTVLEIASTTVVSLALSGAKDIELLREMEPVGLFATTPMVLEVHPEVPARNLTELVAYAKANPGKLACASGSTGSTAHLLLELLKQRAGLDITHVPYQGGAAATTALMGGHVQMYFDVMPAAIPAFRDGRVRLLAVTAPQRVSMLPDVPTFVENGLPDMVAGVWLGMLAPKGTPAAIMARLNQAMNQSLADPAVVQRLQATGSEPAPGPAEKLSALIKADYEKWSEVVRRAGLKPNT